MTTKTVLILGAQGVLGNFTARALQAAGHRVLRGGRRVETTGDFRLVDLDRIETLMRAIEGVDLVVSSIPDPQVRAERAILQHGGLLLSQASVPAPAQRLLEADAKNGANGRVVLNSGLTGVCGLVAKDMLEQFPEGDTVELGFIISISGSAGLAGCRTAHGWLTAMPGLPTVKRLFSQPRGLWSCFDLSGNDIIWLSSASTGGRKILAHMGIAEKGVAAFLMLLYRAGLLRVLPEGVLTAGVKLRPAPKELSREPIRMRAAVYRQGKLLAARGIDAEGDYNSTALSTMLFSQSLLELCDQGGVPHGVCNVEDLFELKDLHIKLNDRRIFVHPLTS